MKTELRQHLTEFPPPHGRRAGWYPDPLGSTAERFWDGQWLDLIRSPQLRLPPGALSGNGQRRQRRREALRLPTLELPALKKSVRAQRAREREQRRQLLSLEARKDAFRLTPAGRARRAFEHGHRLFQYELELGEWEPIEIPGVDGEPASLTADPVDILNSVIVEGWKLEAGSFYFVESRSTAIGCYLFKRSKKRRRPTRDPWDS